MNTPNKAPRYFIGLDAGQQTGLATWDAAGERFAVLTTRPSGRPSPSSRPIRAGEVVVVIEDPSLNRTTLAHGTPRKLQAARRREKISRDIGRNQREAKLLADGLGRKGYRVRRKRPRSRKLSAQAFRRLTGYTGRTSQHARDAALLVYGLRNVPLELTRRAAGCALALALRPTRPI